MSDDKTNRGEPDRSLVSLQPWEIDHFVTQIQTDNPMVPKERIREVVLQVKKAIQPSEKRDTLTKEVQKILDGS